MTLEELVRRFRVLAEDAVAPYLFSTEEVSVWLSDAQDEAAIRARLLLEDALPTVCRIPVLANTHTYRLHPKLYEIVLLRYKPTTGDTQTRRLELVSREWLNAEMHDWRDSTRAACYAIQNETSLRIVPTPTVAGVLTLEGYRLPLKALENDTDKPEIHEASHAHLIQWALFKAFGKPDAETNDPTRASRAEAEFSRYFGLRTDAGLRRSSRADRHHHNQVW